MILYRLAKWMEEREALTRAIHETQGDAAFFQHKRDKVDEELLAQTKQWQEADSNTAAQPWKQNEADYLADFAN